MEDDRQRAMIRIGIALYTAEKQEKALYQQYRDAIEVVSQLKAIQSLLAREKTLQPSVVCSINETIN